MPCAKPSSAAERDSAALKQEIARHARARARRPSGQGRGNTPRFDVKHSTGGMIDVEFATQYLVLSQSAAHPQLIDNLGNIALLERAEAAALLPTGVGHAAADAYRELRRVQHHARLNEEPTHVAATQMQPERDAVLALWRAVFGV